MDQSITARKPVQYPTEPDTTIAVGDRVRSFDYDGNHGCYFVGQVTKADELTYWVQVEFQVWEGKRSAVNHCATVRPPINGLANAWGRTFVGVQRMEEGEEL